MTEHSHSSTPMSNAPAREEYSSAVLKELRHKLTTLNLGSAKVFNPFGLANPSTRSSDTSSPNKTVSSDDFPDQRALENFVKTTTKLCRPFQMSFYGVLLSQVMILMIILTTAFLSSTLPPPYLLYPSLLLSLISSIFIYNSRHHSHLWKSHYFNICLYALNFLLIVLLVGILSCCKGVSLVMRLGVFRTVMSIPIMTSYSLLGPSLLQIVGDCGLAIITVVTTMKCNAIDEKITNRNALLQYLSTALFYAGGAVYYTLHHRSSVHTFQGISNLITLVVEKLLLQFRLNGFMSGDPNWWHKSSTIKTDPGEAVKQSSSFQDSSRLSSRRIIDPSEGKFKACSGDTSSVRPTRTVQESPMNYSSMASLTPNPLSSKNNTHIKEDETITVTTSDIDEVLKTVYFTKHSRFEAKLEDYHNPQNSKPFAEVQQAFVNSCNSFRFILTRMLIENPHIQLKIIWKELNSLILGEYDCSVVLTGLEIIQNLGQSPENPRSPHHTPPEICSFKTMSYWSQSENCRCYFSKMERSDTSNSNTKSKPADTQLVPETLRTFQKIDTLELSPMSSLGRTPKPTQSISPEIFNKSHRPSLFSIVSPVLAHESKENTPLSVIMEPICSREETSSMGSSGQGSQPSKAENSAKIEEMISVVVHDMRSPLMCITGNLELINFELRKSPSYPLLGPLIKASVNASALLESLVSDILDSARMARGIFKISEERMNLEDTILQCLETIELAAKARGNELKCEFSGDKLILSDNHRIKQVLLNILGNAVKFTQNGTITVTVTDNDLCKNICIRDTGQGISPENVKKLFEKYNSSRELSSNSKGIGLGLFISKSIIEALGPGTQIKVESKLGEGTAFSFDILKNINNHHSRRIALGSTPKLISGSLSFSGRKIKRIGGLRNQIGSPVTNQPEDVFSLTNQIAGESRKIIQCKMKWDLSWTSKKSSISVVPPPLEEQMHLSDSSNNNSPDRTSPTPNLSAAQRTPSMMATPGLQSISEATDTIEERTPLNNLDNREIKVLIIDDEIFLLEIMVEFFNCMEDELGIEIVKNTAGSLKDATALVDKNNYDVIIVDFNLPDGKGTSWIAQTVAKLRSESRHLPLFSISSGLNEVDVKKDLLLYPSEDCPLLSILTKPLSLKKFKLFFNLVIKTLNENYWSPKK